MKKLLFILLIPILGFSQTQIGSDIEGEAANDLSGFDVSMSEDGTIVAIGAPGNNGDGGDRVGQVRVFQNTGGVWTQIGSDIDGENNEDSSGQYISLSSDGNVLAVGSLGNDDNGADAGHVRVFQNTGGTWIQIGSDIDGVAEEDRSGACDLSSDGSIVAVGGSGNDGNGSNSGHVRVFKNISNVWTQIGDDIYGVAEQNYSGSGPAISISSNGTVLAIGASSYYANGYNTGHVRVFKNISDVWTQIGSDIDGLSSGDRLGASVSLSSDGNIVAIGAPMYNIGAAVLGQVSIFENISDVWTPIGTITGEIDGDEFGRRVSLSSDGTIVATGMPNNDGGGTNSGLVQVYKNVSGVWIKLGDDIEGEDVGSHSGHSVSLSGDGNTVATGAIYNNDNGANSGQIRVYDMSSAVLSSDNFVQSNFTIYPNPVSEFLTITLENNINLEKVKIYNTLGRLVKTETSNNINVSNLAVGTYYVQVMTNQGIATKSIIVK